MLYPAPGSIFCHCKVNPWNIQHPDLTVYVLQAAMTYGGPSKGLSWLRCVALAPLRSLLWCGPPIQVLTPPTSRDLIRLDYTIPFLDNAFTRYHKIRFSAWELLCHVTRGWCLKRTLEELKACFVLIVPFCQVYSCNVPI